MGWIVGYEKGDRKGREDGQSVERTGRKRERERVVLSELRIIITVVVGAARRRRGAEQGDTRMMDHGEERRDDERPLPRGMEKGVFTHRQYTPVTRRH